jgi:hypothetical protein
MEFYELPSDIKRIIFNINREDAVERQREIFNMVLDDIRDLDNYCRTDLNKGQDEEYDEQSPISEMLMAREVIRYQYGGEDMFINSVNYSYF